VRRLAIARRSSIVSAASSRRRVALNPGHNLQQRTQVTRLRELTVSHVNSGW
jgi:hypothetical protein